MKEKPMFIPLKTEWYQAFIEGRKTREIRRYNGQWSENSCYAGRKVILSKGYGKYHRSLGKIVSFQKLSLEELVPEEQQAMREFFPTHTGLYAVIEIALEKIDV